MSLRHRWRALTRCALALPWLCFSGPANAALFWEMGVHTNDISVCFAGDSQAQNPTFANLIKTYMKEFEWYSGIRFTYINGGVCPPAIPHPSDPGRDFFAGTIRIIVPGVTTVNHQGFVQGNGCPPDPFWQNADGSYNGGNNGWGSWANPPNDLELRRSCVYNVKMGDDDDFVGIPWRNHTLHEIGHAIGLFHEHQRNDTDPTCNAPGYGGTINSGFMTPYDRDSVMNYEFPACGIAGNYSHSGLSRWDRLAIHILYPESAAIAELRGNLVVRAGSAIVLKSAWSDRGALIDNVAENFVWRLNGTQVGSGADLSVPTGAPGLFTLQYSYNDRLVTVPARNYNFLTTLRVLRADDYDRLMGAISNAGTMMATAGTEDADGDGINDAIDNCLAVRNSRQADTDGVGVGNACDADIAIPNDCLVNFRDLLVLKTAFFATPASPSWNRDADFNSDSIINFLDLLLMQSQFFGPPGPSASGCN